MSDRIEKAVTVLAPVEALVFDNRHCSPSCDYNESVGQVTRCILFNVPLSWDEKRITNGDLRCSQCREGEIKS